MTHFFLKAHQVVRRCQSVRRIRPERPLLHRKHFEQHLLRLEILPLANEGVGQGTRGCEPLDWDCCRSTDAKYPTAGEVLLQKRTHANLREGFVY